MGTLVIEVPLSAFSLVTMITEIKSVFQSNFWKDLRRSSSFNESFVLYLRAKTLTFKVKQSQIKTKLNKVKQQSDQTSYRAAYFQALPMNSWLYPHNHSIWKVP